MQDRKNDARHFPIVATEWARQLRDDVGKEYSRAVSWCLQRSLGIKTRSEGQWQKDFLREVRGPLQRSCATYV